MFALFETGTSFIQLHHFLSSCMEFVRKFGLLSISRWKRPPRRHAVQCGWRTLRFNATLPQLSGSRIVLRDYQEESIQSVLKYLGDGHRRLGISLATGAGKTVIFTQLIDRVPPRDAKATKTMIIVHRRELVEQAAKHCRLAYPDKIVEIEMAQNVATGHGDIIIASVQTLSRGRINKFDPSDFKLILVDEAHHIVARSYREVLGYFGLNEPNSDAPVLVGVSATFSRFDGLKLGAAIDHIVYHKDYVDMIDKFGDFALASLSQAVNTANTNNITVRAWMANSQDRKSTLVFCVDVEHARRLTATFREHGVDARYVTATTHKNARSEQLEAFKNQEYPVLLNCGLFTEGTDIPNIDCVLLARPTRSRNLLIQMIGRGLRLFPGKKDCHIIDMVASLETGVLSTPTLFGLHPDEVLEKSSVKDIQKGDQEENNSELHIGPSTEPDTNINLKFTKYDSVYDLLEDTQSERHIRSLSQNSWVRVDDTKYLLSESSGWLTIEHEKEMFVVRHVMKFNDPTTEVLQFTRPRLIASGPDLETAVRAADTYAGTKFEKRYISSRQPWRQSPATSAQIAMLNKARIRDGNLKIGDLTRGQATDIITKLKFGGKKRFKQAEVKQRKLQRKENELNELRRRTNVKVGPLEG
ncbi:ATP-dependent helicase IRC3 [Penicillium sp. IBT 35674x]|nr:ATP-dependent helicase IRC3 [Penicillium sp. IBT 35674x]